MSPVTVDLEHEIDGAARSDARILIIGESGVGKELVARETHARSVRGARAFIPVKCAGVPETLLQSELFGHVEGSFTGAYRDRSGKLELAHGGTVFLDAVGEMSLRMQGLLLRFLETGELQTVGSQGVGRSVDVRVIAATSRPLRGMIAQGLFREDLFARLNTIPLVVPPLRERKAHIAAMAEDFLRRFSTTNRSIVEEIAPAALAALIEYAWPGNLRELENVIERLVVVGRTRVVTVADLPAEIHAPRPRQTVAAPARKATAVNVVDDLYARLTSQRESFWTSVYPLYMQREITRTHVRDVVQKGLEEARGNYKIMVQLFNMEAGDYKKFLNFLRKHQCQLPFKDFRQISPAGSPTGSPVN